MRTLCFGAVFFVAQSFAAANAQDTPTGKEPTLAPPGNYACACVRPASDANSVRLYYMGNNDGSKLSSVTRFTCTSDAGACLDHMRGGWCPFDINPNFSLVQVPNSPRC